MSYQVLGSVRYRQGLPAEALELVAERVTRALDAADAPSKDHGVLHDLGSQFCLSVGDLDGAQREADRVRGDRPRLGEALADLRCAGY